MSVTITAVGPDNRGLADPIVHFVTTHGANISEIQMYDHDSSRLFAMMMRIDWPIDQMPIQELRQQMDGIGEQTGLTIRTWSATEHDRLPRLAIFTTFLPYTAQAILEDVADGSTRAEVPLMIGNRAKCRPIAERFGVDWYNIGDAHGMPDYKQMLRLIDQYEIDYVVLARFMRVLPADVCWQLAGRIINLHHGLLPGFPGMTPYEEAYKLRMLTFGATCHYIVPELDAGNQIIHQQTFCVPPNTPLEQVKHLGQTQNEPDTLRLGVRRVVHREVELHFHRVLRIQ